MNNLTFFWIAIFSDGTKINQVDEDGTIHEFQEVLNRFSDLIYFNLTDKKGKFFTVNLKEGIIGYNDLIIPYRKSEIKKENIRLIYFRRVYRTFGLQDLKQKKVDIIYYLGYQYQDEKNNNRQIILQIDSKGNWILEN
jgi:hypothetical protein